MRPTLRIVVCLLIGFAFTPLHAVDCFVRGDTNLDGTIDIADPIRSLSYLFSGAAILCVDAADSNDDGAVDVADPIHQLAYLFSQGPSPTTPFPECGPDPTRDSSDCAAFPDCSVAGPVRPIFGQTRPVAGRPIRLDVGDIDEDGSLDVVSISFDTGDLTVLFGNGAGFLDDSITIAAGPSGEAVAIRDVDADGHLDEVPQPPPLQRPENARHDVPW